MRDHRHAKCQIYVYWSQEHRQIVGLLSLYSYISVRSVSQSLRIPLCTIYQLITKHGMKFTFGGTSCNEELVKHLSHNRLLTHKQQEMHGCVLSTGYWCLGAKALGPRYPQCWLNLRCIGPVSYRYITFVRVNVRQKKTFWKKSQLSKA